MTNGVTKYFFVVICAPLVSLAVFSHMVYNTQNEPVLVCGEDCYIQICPSCADANTKSKVVDFIMGRTMEDIDINQNTLDEILITLPICSHSFTVETLDGHCDMTQFYRGGAEERWIGFQNPPTGFLKPPTCPMCRSAITSPRYG